MIFLVDSRKKMFHNGNDNSYMSTTEWIPVYLLVPMTKDTTITQNYYTTLSISAKLFKIVAEIIPEKL